MQTIEKIDDEITKLQEKLKNVKGTRTEVYTRIVGYHRAVDNWNNGKREEYGFRRTFKLNNMKLEEKSGNIKKVNDDKNNNLKDENLKPINIGNVSFYKIFTSQYCRNCPPVKDYVKDLPIIGEEVDVSTDLGINTSRKYNILSTPTVILFDNNDKILFKAHSVEELKEVFTKEKELVN